MSSEIATAASRGTPSGCSRMVCSCSRNPRPLTEIGMLLSSDAVVTAVERGAGLQARSGRARGDGPVGRASRRPAGPATSGFRWRGRPASTSAGTGTR
jgi:hypothetical protein